MRTWVRTALSAFATTSLAALAAFASTNPAPTAVTYAGRVAPLSDVPAGVPPFTGPNLNGQILLRSV